MSLLQKNERLFAQRISRLGYANPFLQERLEAEKAILGDDWKPYTKLWSHRPPEHENIHPQFEEIAKHSKRLVDNLRERLAKGETANETELNLYEDTVLYMLFDLFRYEFDELLQKALNKPEKSKAKSHAEFYDKFLESVKFYFDLEGCRRLNTVEEAPHIFACFFQIRRAFHYIYYYIIGESIPAAQLRASVWQSIFTRDIKRYRRSLFDRMGDVTCLICGPSGTGKELVARAIGHSRYIPFDDKTKSFTDNFAGSFYPLNLSALSPTLIESELFGHRRGAYTGALEDRKGWLEICPPMGTVFLDEIGELDPSLQVKLLRVLESRTFQRIGDTTERRFKGKIIAATNRDLSQEMRESRFRPDLFYRLCADQIKTPSLYEQLNDSDAFLPNLLRFLARRIVGKAESNSLASEVYEWIEKNMPQGYSWPGNVRELEQCVRNIMIRGSYTPPLNVKSPNGWEIADEIQSGRISAEELLTRYCTFIYAQTGSYQEAGRRLGLDHRTVKSKVDEQLLNNMTQK